MDNFYKNTLLFIVISIGITFVFSVVTNSILLKFSQNLGARKNTKEIRWSPAVRPSVGGITFFFIFLISFISLNFINNFLPIHFNNLKIIGVLIVCTIAFLMGLADDAYNTQPILKFVTQLICGLVLYFTDTKINLFESETINLLLTIFWVIGFMNSINMLDNMDAISTIASVVILSFVIILNFHNNQILSPLIILSLGLIGALLGFLVFNWHPAKMFMGDTGSQFLGSFLAIVGIEYCFNINTVVPNYQLNSVFIGFLIIALVFLLPLTDTITVSINRLLKGNSPFVGGKDHTTHHLFFKGITEKRIALLYAAIGFTGVFLALKLVYNYQFIWLVISIAFCSITFLSLYLNTIFKYKK